jgi:hypothetical protein
MARRNVRPLALASALLLGCTGEIGVGDSDPPAPQPQPQCTTLASPGAPVPMRRLTALQVERSARDALGVATPVAVSDETLFAFRSNISSAVDFVGAFGYLTFAEQTVAAADLSACESEGPACASWLFEDVAPRLFRRPLSEAELARYQTLYAAGVAAEGPREGARWALEAMLQSPTFLYLDEVTRDDGYLDGPSIASRLAFTLWGSSPDAELLAKATAGELDTAEGVRTEAERMLEDPRSIGGLTDFVDQWLRLSKLNDPDARPDLEALGAETLAAMRAEPVQLFRLLLEEDADVATLLTISKTAADPNMAALYASDILSEADGTFTLDPERRAGLLSLPGVMAALSHAEATSPTLRGFAVLSNFLCTPPPPPPAGVSVTLPDIGEGKTTRERLEAHFSDPTCAACHAPMDGIGFAFEGLDWLGRSRDQEFGKPIDDSSTFPLDNVEVTVEGVSGLANEMATSPGVGECVARQWLSYGAGVPDKAEAACLVDALATDLTQPGGLRAMILGFVSSDWYRRGPGAEQ